VNGLGVVDETTKAQVYRAADVFVYPSLNETFARSRTQPRAM